MSLAERDAVKLRSRELTVMAAALYTGLMMQRPPGRLGPIYSRPANAWINRLNERHREFAALELTAAERRALDEWMITSFVSATIQREAMEVSRLTNALREAVMIAKAGQQARLTPARLTRLYRGGVAANDETAHHTANQEFAAHRAQAVETACDWFAAESFAELNPIEQAAIVFLRLVTIQPFARENETTALIAASLFTLRATLPPIIIKTERQPALLNARVESEQMNMQPMVELMADAVGSTLDEMIGFVQQLRSEGK